jgi:hypothetical protein
LKQENEHGDRLIVEAETVSSESVEEEDEFLSFDND